MARVPGWLVAGLLTLGFATAMFGGAGSASADVDGGSQHGRHTGSGQPSHSFGLKASRATGDSASPGAAGLRKLQARIAAGPPQRLSLRPPKPDRNGGLAELPRLIDNAAKSIAAKQNSFVADIASTVHKSQDADDPALPQLGERATALRAEVRERLTSLAEEGRLPAVAPVGIPAKAPAPVARIRDLATYAVSELSELIGSARAPTSAPAPAAAGLPAGASRVVGEFSVLSSAVGNSVAPAIQPIPPIDFPPVVQVIAKIAFGALAALIQAVDGPPVIPPALRDKVEVSSSTLVIAPGHEVEANWYVPVPAEGRPAPVGLIYLQPGFLATAPMYSYTAAYLAERTNSVVVVTTLDSNFTLADGMWVGGDPMHQAVAQLFLDDDRKALNASLDTAALKAGWGDVALPDKFVLVGHSAGGGFAPGVAGYYAEGLVTKRNNGEDAPNQLAGVLMYDGVPTTPVLPNAMERLNALAASGDPDDFVPVYEIGAPANLFNSTSKVDQELSDARPGQFVGVVLDGGVHMDSMQGGNPLIQFVAYLVAGFPQPQNPAAVQELSVGWINDMFDGNIDSATGTCKVGITCAGSYGTPGGPPLSVVTDAGTATAVVIDSRMIPTGGVAVGRQVAV